MRSFKNDGSVLAVTLGFIMVFTLLGLGSIHFVGLQNEDAEKRGESMKAFWLAEAGIDKGKNKLQKVTPVLIAEELAPLPLGEGTYDVYSKKDPDCPHCEKRWTIHSDGVVDGQKRTIKTIFGYYDITNVLTTRGPIKNFDSCPMASVTVDCDLVEEYAEFSLESVFGGLTKSDIVNGADYTYTNPHNSGDVDPIAGVTVVNLTGNNGSLNLTTDNLQGIAFLLIDTTLTTTVSPPTINIAGNFAFKGIIWVIGRAEIKGNVEIHGTVFVESGIVDLTKVSGNTALVYDADAIDAAVYFLDAPETQTPHIISWEEI